jgi:hypothetical protein
MQPVPTKPPQGRRLLLGFLVGTFIGKVLLAAIPSAINLPIKLTPSNKVDTRYRDGNDGTATLPLAWAVIPAQAGIQGTPQTINLRSLYLTEPGSPSATLTYSAGCTGGGWTTGVDGLSYTYASAYSGTCQVTATRNTNVAASNTFAISSSATAGADATAPASPIGVTATADGTGIQLSFRPSSDPYRGAGEQWSGLHHYNVYMDGAGSPTTSVNAPGVGLQVQLAATEIGGSTSGSLTQATNGVDYTLVSNGSGFG